MKKCYKCKQIKELNEFHTDNSRKDKKRNLCKKCDTIKWEEQYKKIKSDPQKWATYLEKIKIKSRKRYKINGAEKSFIRRYGFPKDFNYYDIFNKINREGKCHICDKKTKLFMEHNHKTKKIRGLLCIKCNTAIAFLNDDISLLKRAIKYLENN